MCSQTVGGRGSRKRVFGVAPSRARARAPRTPRARARAISTACARELDCVRTRFGLARASLMAACVRACVRGWLAGWLLRACVRACVAGWLAAGCWLHQNVPRTRQNSQEQAQSDPRTHQNDPRIVCLLVCLFVSLFVSVCLCLFAFVFLLVFLFVSFWLSYRVCRLHCLPALPKYLPPGGPDLGTQNCPPIRGIVISSAVQVFFSIIFSMITYMRVTSKYIC